MWAELPLCPPCICRDLSQPFLDKVGGRSHWPLDARVLGGLWTITTSLSIGVGVVMDLDYP